VTTPKHPQSTQPNVDAQNIVTLECGTTEAGTTVIIRIGGDGFKHRYALPTTALGTFIEQLLKIHSTARANAALGKISRDTNGPPINPVLETFLVNELSVVNPETAEGPLTVRIESRDGTRDIVFQQRHWDRLGAQVARLDAAKLGGISH
jgi:hypothetical protein